MGKGQDEMISLSHTSMACARTCRRQYHYRYVLRLRAVEEAQALRFGQAWHCVMEERRLHPDMPFADVLSAIDGMNLEQAERIAISCMAMSYFKYYVNVTPRFKVVEKAWTVPLINPDGGVSRTFNLTGRTDAVDDQDRIWETKTSGEDLSGDSDLWVRLRMDPQLSLYYYVMRTMGLPVGGIIYDVVRKPGLKFSRVPELDEDGLKVVLHEDGSRAINKNGSPRQTGGEGLTVQTREETPEEFTERLLADIADRPEYYFQQRLITRLDEDVLDYLRDIWQQAKALHDALNNGRWFRNVSHHTCKWCEYAPLCLHSVTVNPEEIPPSGFCFAGDINE